MKTTFHYPFGVAILLAALLLPVSAGAGNTWLDANGIRVDNVKLNGAAVDNLTYKADPPFVTTNVPPNVLIVLDNSGSMNDWAYSAPFDSTRYVPGDPVKRGYYGYFDPSKNYRYTGTEWEVTTSTTGTTGNPVASGDFLNWATMRRIDAARKLLIGGKATPRSPNPGSTVALYGESSPSPSWDFAKSNSEGRMSPFPAVSYSYEMRGDRLYVVPNYTVSDPAPRLPKSNANATWLPSPSSSSLYRTVDDKTINDNDDYIYNRTTTASQLFGYTTFTPAELPGIIQSVTVRFRALKTSNGTNRIKGVITVGGTEYQHTNYSNLSTSWSTYQFTWTVNPKRYDACVAALDPDPTTCAAWRTDDLTNTASTYYLNSFGVYNVTNPSSSLYPMVTWLELTVSLAAPSGGPYNIKVNWKGEDWAYQQGIIPSLGDEARFGLAMYNRGDGQETGWGTPNNYDGGHIENIVNFGQPVNMVTTIHNMTPSTWTPLAETLFEMVRYFRQNAPYYKSTNFPTGTSTANDPFYYKYTDVAGSNLPDQYVSCAKSFILMITDGESTKDKNMPTTTTGVPGGKNLRDYDADGKDPGTYPSDGTNYLDDVALWARTVDARPDLTGNQNIYLYSVFAFGRGSQLLKDAAVNGGFEDLDGNGLPGPDVKEYLRDSNNDGIVDSNDLPMTYFEGDDGYELESSILNAITAILKRASSGTSVSVLGSSWKGQGALYQAYFYPEKTENLRRIKWTGYFRSLMVDVNGLLHEDTDGNAALTSNDDKVINIVYDGGSSDTMVEFYWDKNGDGILDSVAPIDKKAMDQTVPLWDAGKLLAYRDAADRTIYTTVDPASPTLIAFNSANASTLRPYVRGKTDTDADKLIRFVRGEQITGWRDRQLTIDGALRTWKLGDIVFSDPVVVQQPMELYHHFYASEDYSDYFKKWKDRRAVVYVGTNDGMLRAFNGGFSRLTSTNEKFAPTDKQVEFTTGPNGTSDSTKPLGKELWGFVPYDLLPHLAWLADPDYQHVFYVDMTARVTDARIFTPDEDHVQGWGTIIILGLRLGGGQIDMTDVFSGSSASTKAFKSAYYALDVTNPDKPPVLLWRFTDAELGFTTVLPTVMRQDPDTTRHNGNEKWFLIFGSGPSNYLGGRVASVTNDTTNAKFTGLNSTNARLFVLDLKTGAKLATLALSDPTTGVWDPMAVSGNVTSIDYRRVDFNTDTAYLGVSHCTSGCNASGVGTWGGKLYRIVTKNNTDPTQWSVSVVFDAGKPIQGKPALAGDEHGNNWVVFGTGRFIHVDDRFDTTQNALYGMKDPYWNGIPAGPTGKFALSELANVTGVHVMLDTGQFESALSYNGRPFNNFLEFDSYMLDDDASRGWYLTTQTAGERFFTNGLIAGGLVAFPSFTPSTDICTFEGWATQYFPWFRTGTAFWPAGTDTPLTYTTGTGKTALSKTSDPTRGVPSQPSVHVDSKGDARLFIQNSTGAITIQKIDPPTSPSGGRMSWMEKTVQ